MFFQLVIEDLIVTVVTVDRSSALGCDRSELAHDRMVMFFAVIDSVVVTTGAIVVLATATQVAARHAEPKVGLQVALTAMSKLFCCDRFRLRLVEVLCVGAGRELKLPLGDGRVIESRLGHHD